jgi:hypothetical protein
MSLPVRKNLGQQSQSPLYALHHKATGAYDDICDVGPKLLGYVVPPFQRAIKWSDAQMIRFIESMFYGISPGFYTYNSTYEIKENAFVGEDGKKHFRCGNWLLDGQQRLTAIERYWNNEWPVFNLCWADLSKEEKMGFLMGVTFIEYETKIPDEQGCRELYDLLAFGGVPHEESERALPFNGSEK